eukprot:NODE_1914_length_519_cov_0.690476.p2 type:complete len:117 gc:universal NODE_1914_length_519_cov_0.690476:79-429(+)
MTSGAIQHGVPTNVFLDCFLSTSNEAVTPKSPNRTVPSSSIKTFPALISRCMCPFLWRYSSPISTCLKIVATVVSSNPSGCAILIISRQLPPLNNGVIMYNFDPDTNDAKTRKTLG